MPTGLTCRATDLRDRRLTRLRLPLVQAAEGCRERKHPSVSISFAAALRALAVDDPNAPAVTDELGTLTRGELDVASDAWAQAMLSHGVGTGDIVSICLPSDRSFVTAAVAAWKIGATPQPLSPKILPHELQEIVDVTAPKLVVGRAEVTAPAWHPDELVNSEVTPLPDATAPSWKAPTSGGSTGRPKVIVSTSPSELDRVLPLAQALRLQPGDVSLVPAPLHHNAPFLSASCTLLQGGHVVLMSRFEPVRALELVREHQVTWVYAVPTIMSRIAKLPAEVVDATDLSGVRTLFHMAAPCPEWLKEWWIDKLGGDSVWELYAGTEAQAVTLISGTEWLNYRGSVGRAVMGEIVVLDEDGTQLGPGEVGEIFMRSGGEPTYRYLGGAARARDGWESLGDMGHLDTDGYLYLSDRKTDMVLVGGVNVYPAEIEAALDAHPAVATSCVIGLPDDDVGNRLHAVVQLSSDVTDEELTAFLADRLAPYKRPRTFERVDTPLRDEAGKVRRSAVREARLDRLP